MVVEKTLVLTLSQAKPCLVLPEGDEAGFFEAFHDAQKDSQVGTLHLALSNASVLDEMGMWVHVKNDGFSRFLVVSV